MTAVVEHPQAGTASPEALEPAGGAENGRGPRVERDSLASPTWARAALISLLAMTTTMYMWGLGSSGWEFGYYSAAVQAGTKSLKAAFFGSLDASNFITVDKPPAALWVMEASARVFGLSAWSMLVPEALVGVATVALVYLTVRRWSGPVAGLIAALVTALTPVSAAIFRYNNPDALLVLALVGAAYAIVRAVDGGSTRWCVLAGAIVGIAFLAKMTEAFLVVPALAAVYMLAAPGSFGRRARQLVYAGLALVVSAGWWVLAVQLTPARDRPYIGSTRDNSIFGLLFGYNGLDRLNNSNPLHLAQQSPSPDLVTRALRLLGTQMGSQVSWLVPAAVVLTAASLFCVGRAGRTDRTRAALVLWGSWLVCMGGVFSFGEGVINPYYTVALAPAIGALVGTGGTLLWARRGDRLVRWVLAACIAATAIWSFELLDRAPSWSPWLRLSIVAAGLLASAGLLAWTELNRQARIVLAVAIAFVALAGPTAYSVGAVVNPPPGVDPYANVPTGQAQADGYGPGGGQTGISHPGPALVRTLAKGSKGYRWGAAVVGADPAAGYQLATGDAVMDIGGWSGTDPTPTLAEFEGFVSRHEVHYFIAAGTYGGISLGMSYEKSDASEVTRWVEHNFSALSVGGITLFDLSHVRAAP